MAVITTGAHPKQLWPGVKKIFGATYKEKELLCKMVFEEVSSDKSYEEYVEETGFGLAGEKAEAAGLNYDTDVQGYVERLTNVTYALGAKVSMEAIMDNKYFSVASRKAKKLARSMRHTREVTGANILNRGFTAAYAGGDGKELFATDHPVQAGTQSNELAVAADFSEAALEAALTLIRGLKDSRGLRIQARAQKLVVPSQLEFDAIRVLNSTLQSGTANNDINAVKGSLPGGTIVWDYLTDADAWFVITDVDDGLMYQNRMESDLEQDNDFDTKNACMSTVGRWKFGWGDWRGAVASPGA